MCYRIATILLLLTILWMPNKKTIKRIYIISEKSDILHEPSFKANDIIRWSKDIDNNCCFESRIIGNKDSIYYFEKLLNSIIIDSSKYISTTLVPTTINIEDLKLEFYNDHYDVNANAMLIYEYENYSADTLFINYNYMSYPRINSYQCYYTDSLAYHQVVNICTSK